MDTRRPLRIITPLLILSALQILSAETGRKIPIAEDLYLYLKEIGLNVWIHDSAEEVPPWGKVSANGLAVLAGNEVMLIDTPWNDRQTGDLALWFESEKGELLRTQRKRRRTSAGRRPQGRQRLWLSPDKEKKEACGLSIIPSSF